MKLSEAAQLCEGTSRAFAEVYKLFNFKDEDDLHAYCDFVLHEPVEWMRGFPVAWKSPSMFSKPRAAFHRLMKLPAVVDELGATYCENVHEVVWNAFKTHMNAILEKRLGVAPGATQKKAGSENSSQAVSTITGDGTESLSAESFETESVLEPVPPVPRQPKNSIVYASGSLDYKQKYEALQRVLSALLLRGEDADDENARLRAALTLLLSEYARV